MPPILLDTDVPSHPPVHTTHALYASRNLAFCWLPIGSPPRLELPHPDEPGVVFYHVNLAFLAWVRHKCALAERARKLLTDEQERAVCRVWSHVCAVNKITDDTPERVPAPSPDLMEIVKSA